MHVPLSWDLAGKKECHNSNCRKCNSFPKCSCSSGYTSRCVEIRWVFCWRGVRVASRALFTGQKAVCCCCRDIKMFSLSIDSFVCIRLILEKIEKQTKHVTNSTEKAGRPRGSTERVHFKAGRERQNLRGWPVNI